MGFALVGPPLLADQDPPATKEPPTWILYHLGGKKGPKLDVPDELEPWKIKLKATGNQVFRVLTKKPQKLRLVPKKAQALTLPEKLGAGKVMLLEDGSIQVELTPARSKNPKKDRLGVKFPPKQPVVIRAPPLFDVKEGEEQYIFLLDIAPPGGKPDGDEPQDEKPRGGGGG